MKRVVWNIVTVASYALAVAFLAALALAGMGAIGWAVSWIVWTAAHYLPWPHA